MLAELSRLYNAGGASVIAALVLGSYLLYFLWCALRLWSIDVREHRLPHRILIPLAIATYTVLAWCCGSAMGFCVFCPLARWAEGT